MVYEVNLLKYRLITLPYKVSVSLKNKILEEMKYAKKENIYDYAGIYNHDDRF